MIPPYMGDRISQAYADQGDDDSKQRQEASNKAVRSRFSTPSAQYEYTSAGEKRILLFFDTKGGMNAKICASEAGKAGRELGSLSDKDIVVVKGKTTEPLSQHSQKADILKNLAKQTIEVSGSTKSGAPLKIQIKL